MYMFSGNSSEGRIWSISPSDLEISPPSSLFRGVRPGGNVTVCRKNCLSTGTRCSGFHTSLGHTAGMGIELCPLKVAVL